MSDLEDEELLALAGADDGEETEEEANLPIKRSKPASANKSRKKSRKVDYSDDEDDLSDEDEDDDDFGQEDEEDDLDDGDDDEETEDEQIIQNPYPLEGKYIDQADKAKLESMNEIERESLLYERQQEMEQFKQQEILSQRMRERKRQERRAKKSTKSTKAKKPEPSKKSKLSELKKRRQEKETRNRKRAEGLDVDYQRASSESGEDDYGDEDEYGESDDERVEWAEPEKEEPLTEKALNNIRWSRKYLAKFCYYPGFESVVQNCFVRINMGSGYKVGVVKEVVNSPKPYSVEGTKVDLQLKISIDGKAAKSADMNICSDSSITPEEFEHWKNTLMRENLSLPSMKRIDRKFKELQEFREHQLTNEEIDEMIKRKRQIGGMMGADVIVEKSSLMEARQIALENNDIKRLEEIDQRLEQIDSHLTKQRRQQDKDKLARVNERNRQANLTDIRRAEIAANELRRKAEITGRPADPFSRLKTSAKIFYNSASTTAPQTVEEQVQKNEELVAAAKATRKSSKHKVHVDDVIGALSLNLDFEI